MNKKEFLILISKSIFMKIGVDFYLCYGERRPILGDLKSAYGSPVNENDKIYVPISPLEKAFGIKEYSESKRIKAKSIDETYAVIPLEEVSKTFGINVKYDNMGLIMLSEEEINLDRENNLSEMTDIMKMFVFEYATPCKIYEDAKKYTDNFKHPYLFANNDKFKELKAVYNSKEGEKNYNPTLKSYIEKIVKKGIEDYENIALPNTFDGNKSYDVYCGMIPEKIPVNQNETSDGYDFGGRLHTPARICLNLAFTYRMTGDIKYSKLAYDYSLALGKWEHWGPCHFLNCACASADYAVAYDWLYDSYKELSKTDSHYDIHKIEDICFTHGVNMGYLASFEEQCPWPSKKVGNIGFVYHKKLNNWNAVCTSGMTIASFAIMGVDKYKLESSSLVCDGIYYLANYGLGQYAPDGSYIESPSYWSYGTNHLFSMIAALLSCTGKDYGYLNTWGLDKTCMFALNSESCDYKSWNFHDGGKYPSAIDTSWFPFYAYVTGIKGFMKIREEQLSGGKEPQIYELLYYKEYNNLKQDLPLSYFMEGINTFTARGSWEKGSLYTGLHGDGNAVPHGDLDSGAFIYYNKGKMFIVDMGSDNYNVYGYWKKAQRNRYYRKSTEGANVITITSNKEKLPKGQDPQGKGIITKHGDNGDKAYAILDNRSVYNDLASVAKRGIFVKDKRSVVVIQDEIDFVGRESGYWFAHFTKNEVDEVKISKDKKSAYLTAKISENESVTLRAKIVSKINDLKFDIMDCYTYVFEDTCRVGESEKLGGDSEYDRSEYGKLAIRFEDEKQLKFAVVFEMLNVDTDAPVSYEWTDMEDWKI